jgi:hypothetical protein
MSSGCSVHLTTTGLVCAILHDKLSHEFVAKDDLAAEGELHGLPCVQLFSVQEGSCTRRESGMRLTRPPTSAALPSSPSAFRPSARYDADSRERRRTVGAGQVSEVVVGANHVNHRVCSGHCGRGGVSWEAPRRRLRKREWAEEGRSRSLASLCQPRPARSRLRDAPVGTAKTVLTEALASRPKTSLGASVICPGRATAASRWEQSPLPMGVRTHFAETESRVREGARRDVKTPRGPAPAKPRDDSRLQLISEAATTCATRKTRARMHA